MNIVVISGNYPSNFAPNNGAFVYNLMQALALDNKITVITPLKVHNWYRYRSGGYGAERCNILRPLSFSFSNKRIFGFDTFRLTLKSMQASLTGALNKLPEKPDIIYCHFLLSALHIVDYARENNVPVVVASGESRYDIWARLSNVEKDKLHTVIKKIIAVSKTNAEKLINLGFSRSKIEVVPNAVNYELFKPLDKSKCRQKLGLDEDDFVVGFIGHFIERKGPNRVIQAIKRINDPRIKLICVGSGGTLEENNFTTVIPPVPNQELPQIFNAFDVFVLPTLDEGHCNVIEEAMACGIPIISSKGTSVEEQLNGGLGILVNPRDIGELATMICEIRDNVGVRKKFKEKMAAVFGKNSIEKRAKRIKLILSTTR